MPDPMKAPRPSATSSAETARWLLLIHQLPPKPDYLRVKIRRRLRRLGAVALKHTVYLLPNTDEALEDFQWLRQEIETDGGTAVIAAVHFVEGIADEEIAAMLVAERNPDTAARGADTPDRVVSGGTWVTREGVHVDRIASAWLIRRFIDREARFKFVPSRGHVPHAGEIRFDMADAEYTHVGDDCTFQTLVRRFGLADRALRTIGEIVHDIDCKDELFGRPETAGVESLIRGLVRSVADDERRIERGAAILDDLYANYARE
ncbi:MAG TPA: chromate resistance protein ChrB domain-containing protein [Gemmatimonadaceae bacterium]|nr:chromate resistance protein ChrB domain-containing protein [Gemmatimonadaceae bacterium]